jgi:hypothetical protein
VQQPGCKKSVDGNGSEISCQLGLKDGLYYRMYSFSDGGAKDYPYKQNQQPTEDGELS